MESPERVKFSERPETTLENIPNNVIESVLWEVVEYGECPYCHTEQWYPKIPGREYEWDCRKCDSTMAIIG